MRFLILFVFAIIFSNIHSQIDLRIKSSLNENAEKAFYFDSTLKHTAFKPSYFEFIPVDSGKGFLSKNLLEFSKEYLSSNKSRKLIVNPAFVVGAGNQNQGDQIVSQIGAGLDLFAKRGEDKWRFGFTYLNLTSNYMNYQRALIAKNSVVPGMGVIEFDDQINSSYYSGFLNYQANKFFNFELGYGRQFIGDGYRSLLLSNNANASPYFKMTTKFWKIRYTNLLSSHENINQVEDNSDLFQKKYTATHFLDWQVTKWLNLGLFETIVWQADEGKYKRGFDPNYLNPVIFYRPVEFSVGSSDNALIGANLKFTLPKQHVIYFQTILDEFLLAEIQADFNQLRNPNADIRSGWWANKYGVQFGWKKHDWFGLEGLNTRIEYNTVRPFTYAHTNSNQSYSNYNQALAHPLGANFEELLAVLNYQRNKFLIRVHVNYSLKGISMIGSNLGDDIKASNATRTLEFENETAQGISDKVIFIDASLSYIVHEKWKTTASIGFLNRERKFRGTSNENGLVYFSLRTNLFNSYFDY